MQFLTYQQLFTTTPTVIFWGIFLVTLFLFFRYKKGKCTLNGFVKKLIWIALGFRVINAISLTLTQYFIWASDPNTKIFIETGLSRENPIADSFRFFPFLFGKMGYFLFYSYGRFWLNVFVVILCSFLFYLFLKSLSKWKSRFFEDGEILLGVLCVLLIGWPSFVTFLIFVFLSVILISIIKSIFFKEKYTTLGEPFLLATLLVLLFGTYIMSLTGLSVLKI